MLSSNKVNRPRRQLIRTLGVMLLGLLVLGAAPEASARIVPLRVMTNGVKKQRGEVMLVMDISGSIDTKNGAGCGGDQPGTIDTCFDGMCSGYEDDKDCKVSGKSQDCISKTNDVDPLFKPACKAPTDAIGSRMFMLKRVMRNILPDFVTAATFGVVTYPQHISTEYEDWWNAQAVKPAFDKATYFAYNRGAGLPAKKLGVTIFLTKNELESGGWVNGAGWDAATNSPQTSFLLRGVTYKRLDVADQDATFSNIGPAGVTLPPATYTQHIDSLYRRADGKGFLDKRFHWFGLQFNDGTYNWVYQGSYYTFLQENSDTGSHRFFTAYRGPQYVDWLGNTWVYRKFEVADKGWTEYPHSGDEAKLLQPLLASDVQADQDAHFGNLMNYMNWPSSGGMGTDQTGNSTPAGQAIQMVQQHFRDRRDGTGPFAVAAGGPGPDTGATCRLRAAIMLFDGNVSSAEPDNPDNDITSLFNDYPSDPAASPIKTWVVCMLPSGAAGIRRCDQAADLGDDGLANNSASSLVGSDEAGLTDAFRTALINALQGDFTTSAPGVTTISTQNTVTIADNVSLLPSTEFPGWQGRLRAVDLTQSPPYVLWEAGEQLAARDWATRRLYTGYPDTLVSSPGTPILMMATDGSGTVNANGTGFTGGKGIRHVWPAWAGGSAAAPTDAEIIGMVQFLAGKGRLWKLDPIVNSVPATVGPPPAYQGVTGHDTYESRYAQRDRFSYVYSNEGALHAFRTRSGNESFVYVPPDALPRLYQLYKAGGYDPDPRNFDYITSVSVRVEDVLVDAATNTWETHLVAPMGANGQVGGAAPNPAGGDSFTVLNVTEPSACSTCALNDPPFTIVANSDDLTGLPTKIGEMWSLPALYYNWGSGQCVAEASFGSGYQGTASGDNEWHNHITTLWQGGASLTSYPLPGSTARVDYGVLSDAVAAIDETNKRQVIATYQADLLGRITRFDQGITTSPSLLINAGADQPFHYAPAVYHTGSGHVVLAASTGSFYEDNAYMSADPSSFYSHVFMMEESGGGAVGPVVDCVVKDICTCPFLASSGSCSAPSERALPNGQPLLIQNVSAGDAMEAFYLYYDRPPPSASGCGMEIGDSWVIRIRRDAMGVATLLDSKQYTKTYASGITIVGRGKDLAVALTGVGKGAGASVTTYSGSAISTGADRDVFTEGIREVR